MGTVFFCLHVTFYFSLRFCTHLRRGGFIETEMKDAIELSMLNIYRKSSIPWIRYVSYGQRPQQKINENMVPIVLCVVLINLMKSLACFLISRSAKWKKHGIWCPSKCSIHQLSIYREPSKPTQTRGSPHHMNDLNL